MSGINSHHNENLIVIHGSISGTGTAAIDAGKGFYLTDNGTGNYVITFDRGYAALVSCIATSTTAGLTAAAVPGTFTPGATGFELNVRTYQISDGAATDGKFSFAVAFEVEDA